MTSCLSYFAPAEKATGLGGLATLGAGGEADSEKVVTQGDKAVVTVTFELCILSTCERAPASDAIFPSRFVSFERAYSNAAGQSPLLTHEVACVRISGKWFAVTPPHRRGTPLEGL